MNIAPFSHAYTIHDIWMEPFDIFNQFNHITAYDIHCCELVNFTDNSSKVCLANGSWSGPTDYYDCMCKVGIIKYRTDHTLKEDIFLYPDCICKVGILYDIVIIR